MIGHGRSPLSYISYDTHVYTARQYNTDNAAALGGDWRLCVE